MEIITKNETETKKLGKWLAKKILKKESKTFVLALKGELGSGKTTFLKGFARGLGIKEKILSPSFILMRKFKIRNSKFKNFYHIDCYRIKKAKEILGLGFNEIIRNSRNIIAIEWADRIRKIIPKDVIWVVFKFFGKNKRKILIKNG